MTDVDVEVTPQVSDGDEDDMLWHLTCCQPLIAICGKKLRGETKDDPPYEERCKLCESLIELDLPCSPACNIGWSNE